MPEPSLDEVVAKWLPIRDMLGIRISRHAKGLDGFIASLDDVLFRYQGEKANLLYIGQGQFYFTYNPRTRGVSLETSKDYTALDNDFSIYAKCSRKTKKPVGLDGGRGWDLHPWPPEDRCTFFSEWYPKWHSFWQEKILDEIFDDEPIRFVIRTKRNLYNIAMDEEEILIMRKNFSFFEKFHNRYRVLGSRVKGGVRKLRYPRMPFRKKHS